MRSSASDKQVSLIGAGGHARSVIVLLERNGIRIEGVYDPSYTKGQEERICGYLLKGVVPGAEGKVVLAVGNNAERKKFYSTFGDRVYAPPIAHPTAILERDFKCGDANLIFAGCFVNSCVSIGHNNIINTRAIIEHECRVGDHNHISVGTTLCGRVSIGDNCFIGAGAVVIDRISICSNVTVGANAVVVKNISEPGIYAGNPAVRIK